MLLRVRRNAAEDGLIEHLLTRERLERFGFAACLGLLLGFAAFLWLADGTAAAAGGRLGGDWAPFRAAGVLARTDPSLLLDIDAQRAEVEPWLGGEFLPFPYPPVFAFLFIPFSWLSFTGGYVAYVLLLVAAAIVAVRWTMDLLGVPAKWRTVGTLGALTYAGTFHSYFGAQTATLTLLILAATFMLMARGHEFQAGVTLGLLWFKPQFAIPVIGLVLVAGHVRTALLAGATALPLWAMSAAIFGMDWVQQWFTEILLLTEAGNRTFNTATTISPVEWLRGTLEAPVGDVLGFGLALAIGGWAAVQTRGMDAEDLFPLVALALLLTAPHALRYELTLLVPVVGAIAMATRSPWPWPFMAWLLGPTLLLPIPPLIRVTYVSLCAVVWYSTTHVGQPRL